MGGFADRLSARLGGGSFADRLNQRLAPQDDGFEPWSGPDQVPLDGAELSRDPPSVWEQFLGDVGDTGADAAFSAAGGVFSGLGMNPGQAFGDGVRQRLAAARENSPIASTAGKVVGEVAPLVVAAPGLMAAPVIGGAVQGGLSGLGNADTSDWGERLQALQRGGEMGALIGAGFGAAGKGLGAASDWLSDTAAPWLREQGLLNRVASSGLYGGSMDRLGANMGGREGLVDLGQWMENQGLTQWTPSGIGDEAASMNSMWRGDQRNMLDELAARPGGPPMVDTGAIAADMSGAGREAIGLAPEASKLAGARYIREANNLTDAAPSGEMPFAEALQNRQAYDDAVNYSKLGGSSEDAINEEVSRRAANGLRGGLVESLENTSPELAPRWEQIQENLHNSSAIMGAGQSRGIRELGNQPLSLPSLIGAAGGGIPGMAAAAAVKTGGRAGLANLGRGGSAALDTLGAAGQAVGGQAPLAGGVAARAAAGSMSQELQQSTGEGRGNLLTQAALNSLYSGGQDLGPYSSQFAEAAASKDSNAVANLITRLTMSDPQFRVSVLPALQRMTAEAR